MAIEVNDEEIEMPEIDLTEAFFSFECAPHAFMVAMPPIDATRGAIELTDKRAGIKRRGKPACGTVICCGSATGLTPGDWAFVDPKFAKRVAGIKSGNFSCENEVWIYGITSPEVRHAIVVEAHHSVFAVLGRQESTEFHDYREAGGRYRLFGSDIKTPECDIRIIDNIYQKRGRVELSPRVLLALTKKQDSRGRVLVAEGMQDRPDCAMVLAVSPSVSLVRPGDWCIYQRRGMDGLYAGGNKDHAYLPERAIFARCLKP